MNPRRALPPAPRPKFGLARVLSKLGYCSRSTARELILARRVRVDGVVCRDPEAPVDPGRSRVEVDGLPVQSARRIYLMLNKPRGLVTTSTDEKGRATVYTCLNDPSLPWLSPVGRLDKASEGLLLFTNDTAWADRISSPATHLDKIYDVQVDCLANTDLCGRLTDGLPLPGGEFLSAKRAQILRLGTRHSWLQVTLDEGKNRQIRRLLQAFEVSILRLVRIAVGPLQLGSLAKGQYRHLTSTELQALAPHRT